MPAGSPDQIRGSSVSASEDPERSSAGSTDRLTSAAGSASERAAARTVSLVGGGSVVDGREVGAGCSGSALGSGARRTRSNATGTAGSAAANSGNPADPGGAGRPGVGAWNA